ncbi:MAG: exodeoxyribonuclease alpha subunit [Massilia sp.]|jgi:exodeoxyribonuclease V alpha subunit
MTPSVLVRVQSIRSQNPYGRGGCIFVGTEINEAGDVVDAKSYFVVKATGAELGDVRVQPGQWWQVRGESESYERTVNGYLVRERQIRAAELSLMRLSGEHIVTFIAECDDFHGIGMVKARKLWDTFGERLYHILDNANVEALTGVLTEDSARQVIAAWSLQGHARTLQWLQSSGIDVQTGRKLLAYFGKEAYDKLKEDPYRLLSFSVSWKHVDAFARAHFGLAEDDPRRLQAAIEEALYRVFDGGDTVTPIPSLLARAAAVLDGSAPRALGMAALESGLTNGSYIIGQGGSVHPLGALVMETTVAKAIADRLAEDAPLTGGSIDELLNSYEQAEGITLNAEQRQAVRCATTHAFALILGGAGVGKTTVLKAVYTAYDDVGIRIFQTALSGRAAKRMVEATGRPATTLASFFANFRDEDLAGPSVVVVDEASMVDLIAMHRLCELLPLHTRLLLVGDTSQLMPVGPGLVLHVLADLEFLPKVELKQVKRYGNDIAAAAQTVRRGVWPDLPVDGEAPISFVPCPGGSIAELVVLLYEQEREGTQILTARKGNVEGTKSLNELCQRRLSKTAPPLLVYNEEFQCNASTGFHLGDPILCTKNLWDLGLQNGSLGTLEEIERQPRLLTKPDGSELGYALAWVRWDDGERRPVLEWMLEHLELGYAITIHKAQGSQWPRVIVVLTGHRLLDRTLIYTAITRAQSQVIIIGDVIAVRLAVESPPRADGRQVALGDLLRDCIANLLQESVATAA